MNLIRLILCGVLFITITTQAQENEISLDPVTVTSSLNPITASKTGRNILVIEGRQMQNLPVNSIDELLRYLPGLEIQARGPMGSQSDFVIRGGTFQQVLVILDGIRLNDPLTGHFNSYIPIAPAEIDRIEVLKGAASAVYGTEAVGGVIHIITKSFAARNGVTNKGLQAQVSAGEFGLLNANAGGFYSNGKTAIGGGVLSNNADGQIQRGTRGFFHLHTGSVSVSHWLNNFWQIAFRSAYDERKFAAQNYYTTFASDTATEQVKTFWNQLRLSYQKEKNKFSFSAGYKAAEDYYLYNNASLPNDNKSKLVQALAVYDHQFSSATSLTSGVQFQNRSIKSNDRGDHRIAQAAAFIIFNQAIGNNFYFNPALRLDWNERGGTELVPQLNISFKMNDLQLRASAGKTIREADFTERFNNYNKPIVTSGRIGNPDLIAERSFSHEVGADYLLNRSIKISVTGFQRYHDDLIDYVTTPYSQMPRRENLVPAGSYALAKNISSVTTSGLETDIQFTKKLAGNSNIYSSIGFVWLDTKSSEPNPSFYILSHAKLLTNFSVNYSSSRFNFGVNGLYKLRNPQTASAIKAEVTADYFVLNAKAEYNIIKNKFGVFTQIDNLFNRSYSDLLGTPMPLRWWQWGARVTL
jgi:iron complex outermembrane receptor protein